MIGHMIKNRKIRLGVVLVAFGTYSTAIVFLLFGSVVLRFIDLNQYETLRRVVELHMPRLIWLLLWAECGGVLIIIAGLSRPSWQVWRNGLWRTGIVQISFVGLLAGLKALAQLQTSR